MILPKLKLRIPDRRSVYVFNITPVGGWMPFLWLGKVGFSVEPDFRAEDVERSIWETSGQKVRVRKFFHVRVFMYRAIEKAVHAALQRLQTDKFRDANGGTEMFRILNVFTGLLCYCGFYAYSVEDAVWLSLLIMLIPRPLDMAVFVGLLALVEYALVAAALWAGWLGLITLLNFL